MKTPIVDFVREYARRESVRLHMPGHKGVSHLGCEKYDITEIDGADVLYSPDGIILESENNASALFGTAHTYYSTEGSSLCIKAMLSLAVQGKNHPTVLAARNVHKAFVYACALLDVCVEWLYPTENGHLCLCNITPEELEAALAGFDIKPCAVYVTSPDYLGNILDIGSLASVCHKYGVPLLVDNAHGAYLNFLSVSRHPISLGADMCCDSAHKTLPVLTGGAYLHIAKNAEQYIERTRDMLSLFASTSPSYLILQSLDMCNAYVRDGYSERLDEFCKEISSIKYRLSLFGYAICESEPLKIVIDAQKSGTTGRELQKYLSTCGIEIEFSDTRFAVMMLTPENSADDLMRLEGALLSFDLSACSEDTAEISAMFQRNLPKRVMSIREAVFSASESIDVSEANGRVCASVCVSCPPAVPIVVSGELIDERHIEKFEYYGIEKISVVK